MVDKESNNIISSIDNWRKKNISDRQFVLILAFIVGFLAAVAAYILHFIIEEIETLITSGFRITTINWLYLLYPVIGIWLTSLFVKYVVRDQISHGITRVLYAISTKRSKLKAHNTWTSIVASAITIGFGGSVGAEAPIVLTGSAIGSNLGRIFNMDRRTLMLLVGCGATAAVSGIFKAPIAGLVFTLEILMVDLTMASLLPILIASVTATCFSYFFTGGEPMYNFKMDYLWSLSKVPPTILLGVCCGFLSLYFMRVMSWCEDKYASLSKHPYLKLMAGGLVLSSLIFLFPSLYGEGYNSLRIFIEGNSAATEDMIRNFANRLSQRVITLSSADRKYLHLAAVWACNFTNYCYTVASDILGEHGIPFDVMLPLINETTEKLQTLSPKAAQTGPAVRGDKNVMSQQLELMRHNADLQKIYQMLSKGINPMVDNLILDKKED